MGLIENRAFQFTCKFICTQNHDEKLIQMMAQKEIRPMTTQIAKSGTSRPLRKEKWPWHITPIAKRKMAMVNDEKLAAVNQEKCASKVQPISNAK